MGFLDDPIQDELRVTGVPSAAGARIARQCLHDAIGVLRCEKDLGGEILRCQDAKGTGNETDLARDEDALVYLDGIKIGGIGASVNGSVFLFFSRSRDAG